MENYRLSSEILENLKLEHRRAKKKTDADRIKAVVLLGSGWVVGDVAEVLMIDENTVRKWFQAWKNGGTTSLLMRSYTGREAFLNSEQQEILAKWLDENLCQTVGKIIRFVQKTFEIDFSRSGMCALLNRIGFVYKKPKHVPGKADAQKQKEFVEEYRKLRENASETDVFYFGDGCHPRHNSVPAFGWIRRGKEHELKSNCGRQHININGLINIDNHTTCVDFPETINAETTRTLFRKLIKRHAPGTIIHVFVDNAKYYHAKILEEFLSKTNVRLHFLPPYSPNLNPVERLWKFFKKKVLANHYIEHFCDFVRETKNFFRRRKRYLSELSTLITENFHILEEKTEF